MVRRPHYTRQPLYSALCGQTCVAILTGYSVQAVCKHLKSEGPTRYKDLRKVLKKFGFSCGSVKKLKNLPPVAYALCRVRLSSKKYHWLLYWKGKFLDPATPRNKFNPNSVVQYLSYMEVK